MRKTAPTGTRKAITSLAPVMATSRSLLGRWLIGSAVLPVLVSVTTVHAAEDSIASTAQPGRTLTSSMAYAKMMDIALASQASDAWQDMVQVSTPSPVPSLTGLLRDKTTDAMGADEFHGTLIGLAESNARNAELQLDAEAVQGWHEGIRRITRFTGSGRSL